MLKDEIDPSSFIRRFGEVGIEDVPSVGGKNASLGEMIRELTARRGRRARRLRGDRRLRSGTSCGRAAPIDDRR